MVSRQCIKVITEEGKESEHLFIEHGDAQTLVIILPGGNNLCDRPILHYIRKAALIRGYDVLCISYTYINSFEKAMGENIEYIARELEKIVTECTCKQNYANIILIGRSFGSIVSGAFRDITQYPITKHIFISPLDLTMDYIMKYRGLVITGELDLYLKESQREILRGSKDINLILIDGVGHSLEGEESIEYTLNVCSDVVNKVDEYINI